MSGSESPAVHTTLAPLGCEAASSSLLSLCRRRKAFRKRRSGSRRCEGSRDARSSTRRRREGSCSEGTGVVIVEGSELEGDSVDHAAQGLNDVGGHEFLDVGLKMFLGVQLAYRGNLEFFGSLGVLVGQPARVELR